jgi:hypothetical protein
LEDGINFQENSYVIEVGGENQPSEDGVEDFVLGLSNYIDKEIQGGGLSKIGEDDVSYVFIGRYKYNKATKAGFGINLSAANRPDLKINKNVNPKKHWHTHLSRFNDESRLEPSKADLIRKNNAQKIYPDMRFEIITTPENVDYTNY